MQWSLIARTGQLNFSSLAMGLAKFVSFLFPQCPDRRFLPYWRSSAFFAAAGDARISAVDVRDLADEQTRLPATSLRTEGDQSDVASGFDLDDQKRAVSRRRGERLGQGIEPTGKDMQRVSATLPQPW